MDAILGLVGKDFTIIAADRNSARSIIVFQNEEDKIMHLDSHKILGVGGDAADCVQEPQYFQKNLSLYHLKHGVKLSTHGAANYMRGEKSAKLRKGMAQVDMLLGGYDEDVGPSLYFIDYLASMQQVKYGAHGYAGFFCNGLLDALWKPNMTEAEALQALETCFKEIETRFLVHMPNFLIKVVNKDGIKVVERLGGK